jgi:hypothetical protein
MKQDTHTHNQGHPHPVGPCRCQGRCPGCPRRPQNSQANTVSEVDKATEVNDAPWRGQA